MVPIIGRHWPKRGHKQRGSRGESSRHPAQSKRFMQNKVDQRAAVSAGAGELEKELGIGMKPRVRFTS